MSECELREIVSCCLLGMDYLQRKKLTCVGSASSGECVVDQTGQPVSVRGSCQAGWLWSDVSVISLLSHMEHFILHIV